MLTGSYFNTIDTKGRAFVPPKLRYEIGERVWLVKGIDKCVYVMSQDSWRSFVAEYAADLTKKDARARKLQRFIFGNSKEVDIDAQGRINIPLDHREYAGIEKDIAFVGAGDRIELWSKDKYELENDPETLDPDALMREAGEVPPSAE